MFEKSESLKSGAHGDKHAQHFQPEAKVLLDGIFHVEQCLSRPGKSWEERAASVLEAMGDFLPLKAASIWVFNGGVQSDAQLQTVEEAKMAASWQTRSDYQPVSSHSSGDKAGLAAAALHKAAHSQWQKGMAFPLSRAHCEIWFPGFSDEQEVLAYPLNYSGQTRGFLAAVFLDKSFRNESETNVFLHIASRLAETLCVRDTEERLDWSQTRLRWVEEASEEIIWLLDANLCFHYVSTKAGPILGYSASELLGKNWLSIAARENSIPEFNFTERTPCLYAMEWLCRAKDGREVWLRSSARADFDEHGQIRYVYGASQDITEVYQTQLALQRTKEELEIMNRQLLESIHEVHSKVEFAHAANEAKNNFIAQISHEVRTPMNAITGLMRLIMRTELTPPQLDYLRKMDFAARSFL